MASSCLLILAIVSLAFSAISGTKIYLDVYPQALTPPMTYELLVSCRLYTNEVAEKLDQPLKRDVEQSPEDIEQLKNIVLKRNGKKIAHMSLTAPAEALVDEQNMKVMGSMYRRYLEITWTSPQSELAGIYECEADADDQDAKEIHFSARQGVGVMPAGKQQVIGELVSMHHQFNFRPIPRTQTGTGQCGSSDKWVSGPADNGLTNSKVESVDVKFTMPFSSHDPVVSASVTGVSTKDSVRVKLNVRDVTAMGFKVECVTWSGAQVDLVDFAWSALTPMHRTSLN